MKILEPGHIYIPQEYDSPNEFMQTIIFMKRIGDKFPGNQKPKHSGTNC